MEYLQINLYTFFKNNIIMTKQTISFNETSYNQSINSLNKIIQVVNKYTDKLTTKEHNLTIADLIKIANDPKAFKKQHYQTELEMVCLQFGLNYEEYSTFIYTMQNPMFSDMANSKCKVFYDLCNELRACFVCGDGMLADSKFITITNNVASKTADADTLLKEYHTDYTVNDRENKVLDILNQIIGLYAELDKLNIDKLKADHLITPDGKQVASNFHYDLR